MIGTAWSAVVGLIIGAIDALFKWSSVFTAYLLGKRKVQKDQAEELARKKDEQLDEATKPPMHRDDIIDRMRRGGF